LIGSTPLGRHRILFPIWVIVLVIGSYLILKRVEDLHSSTSTLNAISIFLVAMALVQIAVVQIQKNTQTANTELPRELMGMQLPAPAPDIYYIIMDGYGRQDALAEDIQFDNSEFIQKMESLGFYVGRCSQSNYAQTKLSLSSSLNMNYVETYYPEPLDPQRTESHGLEPFVTHPLVRRALERLGYLTVAFETGFDWTEMHDAGIYLAQHPNEGLNGFEALLIRSTAALVISDAAAFVPDLNNPDMLHRDRVLYTLDQLPKLPVTDRPKFVFAHVVSPHPPYVFDAQGNLPAQGKNEARLYREQIEYLNSRLPAIVQEIISESAVPPIIIIQGDHGAPVSSDTTRMQPLNLYFAPRAVQANLYPTITPVNSFRVIFNSVFSAHLPLLKDRSFFSRYQHPFAFEEIPNEDRDCLNP
jgi:hypothetical protein